MIDSLLVGLFVGAVHSGAPLLYATLAEIVDERAGIVNLGLEGVLLIGAVVGFAMTVQTGSETVGLLAAGLAGGLFNLLFGFLIIRWKANQLASGLALMFFGVGLSALIGVPYVGSRIQGLDDVRIRFLSELPVVGRMFFQYDILVYAAVPVAFLVWWLLFSTRWGLCLRAVGENPTAAFAAGKDPHLLQYQALFLAGVLGGIAGAYLSIGLAKTWQEWMTAGRGFIAVALVIFSKWHPLRAVLGALLFGGAIALQLQMQALGVPISPFILDMLPYVLSLGVLAVWGGARRFEAPGSLGRVFQGTE